MAIIAIWKFTNISCYLLPSVFIWTFHQASVISQRSSLATNNEAYRGIVEDCHSIFPCHKKSLCCPSSRSCFYMRMLLYRLRVILFVLFWHHSLEFLDRCKFLIRNQKILLNQCKAGDKITASTLEEAFCGLLECLLSNIWFFFQDLKD